MCRNIARQREGFSIVMSRLKTFNTLQGIISCSFAFFVASCKEPFPPYLEPTNVMVANIAESSKDTLTVFQDSHSGGYFFADPVIINATLTNIYDDLLQGTARVDGKIIVQSFGQAPRTVVTVLTPADLRSPPQFQGNIALPPGEKALFSAIWIPHATDGSYIFDGLPYVQVGNAKLYGPISMTAYSDLQIFENVQSLRSPQIQFSLYFSVEQL